MSDAKAGEASAAKPPKKVSIKEAAPKAPGSAKKPSVSVAPKSAPKPSAANKPATTAQPVAKPASAPQSPSQSVPTTKDAQHSTASNSHTDAKPRRKSSLKKPDNGTHNAAEKAHGDSHSAKQAHPNSARGGGRSHKSGKSHERSNHQGENGESQKPSTRFSALFSRKKKSSIVLSDPYQNEPEVPVSAADLQALVLSRLHEIQRYRDDAKMLQLQLAEAQRMKEARVKNLEVLSERHSELRRQLAKELTIRDDVQVKLDQTQQAQDKMANKPPESLDLRERFTCQMQRRLHSGIGSHMEGYNEYHSSLLYSTMKTLETWHNLAQAYNEKTACLNEAQQKAKQAYTAAATKYKRIKTQRDQLAAELRQLREDHDNEQLHFQNLAAESGQKMELILAKYRDQVQRCLVNRDLKYEAVLEAMDHLVTQVKAKITELKKHFSALESSCAEAVKGLDELLRYRQMKNWSASTTELIDSLSSEAEYKTHLEQVQKVLAEYIGCVQELEEKRANLLRERASLLGDTALANEDKKKCCPCPSEIKPTNPV